MVLEDQIIGTYFDVIPEKRLELIYQALQRNETTCLVCGQRPRVPGRRVSRKARVRAALAP